MKKNDASIYIVGVQSSYISEAIEICELSGFKKIILIDNLNNSPLKEIDGYKVQFLNNLKIPKDKNHSYYCCCMHTPMYRVQVIKQLEDLPFTPTTIIHPSSVISKRALISRKGVIIAAGSIVATHTKVDDMVIINRGAMIGHDINIQRFATIESGAILGGFSNIGQCAYIGMGAKILPKIRIGKYAVVAAGAVVLTDVKDNTMVAGIPAVVKKTNIEGYKGS